MSDQRLARLFVALLFLLATATAVGCFIDGSGITWHGAAAVTAVLLFGGFLLVAFWPASKEGR